jgi:hypothetical protein
MTRLRMRLRALTRPELQTVGYLSGIVILLWWAFTDSNPNPIVVGSVTSSLILQRYVGGRSKETSDEAPVGEVQDVAAGSKRRDKGSGAHGRGRAGGGSRRHHLRLALNDRWPPVPEVE